MVCPHCLCPTRRAGPRPSGLVTSCRDRRPKGLAAALPPSLICPHPHRGARWGRVLSGPAGTANHATRRLSALVRRGSQVPVWIVVLVAVLGRRPSLSLGHHPSSSRPGDCVAANYAIRARNCLFEFLPHGSDTQRGISRPGGPRRRARALVVAGRRTYRTGW